MSDFDRLHPALQYHIVNSLGWSSLRSTQLEAIDRRVKEILAEARERAQRILAENRSSLELLRDMLLEHKVIERKTLSKLFALAPPANSDPVG